MTRFCAGRGATLWLALALLAMAAPAGREALGEVTAQDLQRRIDQLVAEIRRDQIESGAFRSPGKTQFITGQTALAVLALRAAGVPADDPAVARGAAYLASGRGGMSRAVYEKSLKMMALHSVNPAAYRDQIAADAKYLIDAQQGSGAWSYGESGNTDYSNSQFALLGLHTAALMGIEVPDKVWEQARVYYRGGQNADGGWAYRPRAGGSYGSMTAAGVASLHICDIWLHVSKGRCGLYMDERALRGGLDWLARGFSVTKNPGKQTWKFYYLYALERVGVILARRYFGPHDWYREGVEHLVGDDDRQVRAPSRQEWRLLQNTFMLLFLAKGNAPILIHKAQWAGTWNSNRYDAKFLIQFIGDELGELLDWQIIPLSAPLEQLMAAPILYISGKGPMRPTRPERARLREYTDAGGVVLVEAIDGDEGFDAVFRRLIGELYPDDELVELPKDHPIYSAYFDVPVGERPLLEAVKGPCWISILYAPKGLSCPWDVADFKHVNFRLGANVAAYVTGLEKLEGKLVAPVFYTPVERDGTLTHGAFTVGQAVHGGDWRPHKRAWPRVLGQVSQRAGIQVYSHPLPISLDSESPFQAQMLYITGVQELNLNAAAKQALRTYLERGGFIFVEAACGSTRFDRSFRDVVKELAPEQALRALPVGHPLYEQGEALGPVKYSPAVRRTSPDMTRPSLEFVEQDGRAVIVYSKYDLSSAIDGHPCYTCPSVLEPSASRLIMKIVLYGLSS